MSAHGRRQQITLYHYAYRLVFIFSTYAFDLFFMLTRLPNINWGLVYVILKRQKCILGGFFFGWVCKSPDTPRYEIIHTFFKASLKSMSDVYFIFCNWLMVHHVTLFGQNWISYTILMSLGKWAPTGVNHEKTSHQLHICNLT